MRGWLMNGLKSRRRSAGDSISTGERVWSIGWVRCAFICLLLTVIALTGCIRAPETEDRRGELLSANEIATIPRFVLQTFLDLSGIGLTVSHGVQAVAVTFIAEALDGSESVESGLVVLPVAENGEDRAPLTLAILSIQHGTIFSRSLSPSRFSLDLLSDNPEDYVGLVAAGLGYAVVMPDYSGLGVDDTIPHPFCHARSLANSVRDMIRAGENLLEQSPSTYEWDGRLFLAGYSEGGYASLAAGRYIQQCCRKEYSITGIAAMAGPANLSSVMRNLVLQNEWYAHLSYLVYLIFGYDLVYDWFKSPAEAFLPPYHTTLPALMDGEHTENQIRNALPNQGSGQPGALLTQRVFQELSNPGSQVYRNLAQNDLHNTWIPNMPLWMAHSAQDEAVPVENSRTAVNYFQSQGASVTYVEFPTGQHVASYLPAFLLAIDWIESFSR